MTHDDALKYLASRYTGKFNGKWGVATPNTITLEDLEAWECLREHVDVIKEVDAKFANFDEDEEDGIIGMV